MSDLALCLRGFLEAQTGYASQFPGGIHPDTDPKKPTLKSGTFGLTSGTSRNPVMGLSFTPLHQTERITLEVVAATRAKASAARSWAANLIGQNPISVNANGITVRQWRVDDDGTEGNEPRNDASDNNTRAVTLDIVGSI